MKGATAPVNKIQQIVISPEITVPPPSKRPKRPSYELKGQSLLSQLWPPAKLSQTKAYPALLKDAVFEIKFQTLLSRIFEAKLQDDETSLEKLRLYFTKGQMFNLILYDVQATGLPDRTYSPELFQISLFKPLTGESFVTYLTPSIPIRAQVSRLTKVYHSREPLFTLASGITYYNHPLLSHPQVKAAAGRLLPEAPSWDPLELTFSSIDEFLSSPEGSSLTFLDEIQAPPLTEVLPRLLEFLASSELESGITVLLSHNGASWGEPLLRPLLDPSLQHYKNILYLDSKELFRHLFRNIKVAIVPGSDPPWSQLLGENRDPTFDSTYEPLALWRTIEDVFLTLYNRNDTTFIFSRIAEDLYLQKAQLK